jgi:hypothetical protein
MERGKEEKEKKSEQLKAKALEGREAGNHDLRSWLRNSFSDFS